MKRDYKVLFLDAHSPDDFNLSYFEELQCSSDDLEKCLGQEGFYVIHAFFEGEINKKEQSLLNELSIGFSKVVHSEALVKNDLTYTYKSLSELETEFVGSIFKDRKEIIDDNFDMVEGFLDEVTPMLEEMETLSLELEEDGADISKIGDHIFRLLHTVKGTGACVGLNDLAEYTHHFEDFFTSKKNELSNYVLHLLRGLDILKRGVERVRSGYVSDPEITKKVDFFSMSVEQLKAELKNSEDDQSKEDDRIYVKTQVLDDFLELSGEMTVLRNSLRKTLFGLSMKFAQDRDIENLDTNLTELLKISSVMQSSISDLRKVSFETIIKPLKRVARDLSNELGKKVQISVKGEKLLIDYALGKVLSGVLVHMVRNSIDHGIEMPDERVKSGKQESGTIFFDLSEEGSDINLQITDDGKGLNRDKLVEKIIEKSLAPKESLVELTNNEIFDFIFHPGFSTAAQVTDLSGRGVGMDMVRSSVEHLGGRVSVSSIEGKGCDFKLSLPVPKNVLIYNSLIVKTKKNLFAIPIDDIDEIIDVSSSSGEIHSVVDGELVNSHGKLVPMVHLDQVLELRREDDQKGQMIIIVKNELFYYGIVVDEVFEIEECVVKKVKSRAFDSNLYQGAAYLGEVDIALVLDLKKISEIAGLEGSDPLPTKQLKNLEEPKVKYKEYIQFSIDGYPRAAIFIDKVSRFDNITQEDIDFSGNVAVFCKGAETIPIICIDEVIGKALDKDWYLNQSSFYVITVSYQKNKYALAVREISDIRGVNGDLFSFSNDENGILGSTFLDEKAIVFFDPDYLVGKYLKLCELREEELSRNLG